MEEPEFLLTFVIGTLPSGGSSFPGPDFPDGTKKGLMAEWLGVGLQNLLQRFESASDLRKSRSRNTQFRLRLFYCTRSFRNSLEFVVIKTLIHFLLENDESEEGPVKLLLLETH